MTNQQGSFPFVDFIPEIEFINVFTDIADFRTIFLAEIGVGEILCHVIFFIYYSLIEVQNDFCNLFTVKRLISEPSIIAEIIAVHQVIRDNLLVNKCRSHCSCSGENIRYRGNPLTVFVHHSCNKWYQLEFIAEITPAVDATVLQSYSFNSVQNFFSRNRFTFYKKFSDFGEFVGMLGNHLNCFCIECVGKFGNPVKRILRKCILFIENHKQRYLRTKPITGYKSIVTCNIFCITVVNITCKKRFTFRFYVSYVLDNRFYSKEIFLLKFNNTCYFLVTC